MSISIPVIPESVSGKALLKGSISARSVVPLTTNFSNLSLAASIPFKTTPIRMGGGPRTYPGGVPRRQWKIMQAKRAKQLLKDGLARERQIYEIRKRAELKAAVSELERPWETVEKPPNLFSASDDELLKVPANRFPKPGGLDLWSERDGTEWCRLDTGLPSCRIFPKGVVHTVKRYGKLTAASEDLDGLSLEEDSGPAPTSGPVIKTGLHRKNREYYKNSRGNLRSSKKGGNLGVAKGSDNGNYNGKLREKGKMRTYSSDSARNYSRDYRRNNTTNRWRGETNQELWTSKKGREKGAQC